MLFDLTRTLHAMRPEVGSAGVEPALAALRRLGGVLGLFRGGPAEPPPEIRAEVDRLLGVRADARRRRAWGGGGRAPRPARGAGRPGRGHSGRDDVAMAREDGERLILYGRHPVLEALRSGGHRVDEVLVEREGGRGADVVALARQAGVRCSPAPREALTALAGTPHHQGVVARVDRPPVLGARGPAGRPPEAGRARALAAAGPGPGPREPRQPPPDRRGPRCPRRGGAPPPGGRPDGPRRQGGGRRPRVPPVARVGNLAQSLEVLQGEGYWVIGASAGPSTLPPPWRLDLRGPLAVVLGSEGRGLRPLVARRCDALTRIPSRGGSASLNVGAAGAVLLYEVVRQRAMARGKAEIS